MANKVELGFDKIADQKSLFIYLAKFNQNMFYADSKMSEYVTNESNAYAKVKRKSLNQEEPMPEIFLVGKVCLI